MAISFQEFLRQKAEESGWKDRNRSRKEWLEALDRLFGQIRDWLRESDPNDLLEVVPYRVERVEQRLGVYDAPALKIRVGTDSVDVLPVGRHAPKPSSLETLLGVPGNRSRWGDLSGGRVDITDGERRHLLLRSIEDENDCWYVVMSNRTGPIPFDREGLEAILVDLLS